ncbi:aminomethyl-transferring glycine dehydrogenase subunit GcvPA [Oceanimonas baumannii]|uniref:aminomethyl-transferring glycine dehydrogenase subunit GcvPA n=1 Tax=Oceanimonas baumannii TaxID=129578 RepID=UPI001D17F185|nr:aminomethyl-transferring glycine dehydrogenase subunit GcvPA [Oceanimonas baumannii]MCC4265229.1 aminomethyl-transferring glycine dehydrogenase subunit GcvPA [Oceanimonas baumannii]
MTSNTGQIYPYIPNTAPGIREQMLAAIGVESIEDLLAGIPAELRLNRPLNFPEPFTSEYALKRHVDRLLGTNTGCHEVISFLGGGCYQHHVPAVCDEINGRSEFLTAYAGEPYDDHGRFQAMFEYCSMMGELLNMEVVSVPCYDGFQASASALSMASRHTGRRKVLLPANINPDKLAMIRTYCRSSLELVMVPMDRHTGLFDMEQLNRQLDHDCAALYFEVPAFLGQVEDGQRLTRMAHDAGALAVVAVDPSSLGVVAPPADYGADLVCGDIQPLGIHMQYGGGHGGFIASHDIPELVMQYPSRLFGIAPTKEPGEYGFGDVAFDRTSFSKRENGNEFVGTASALWGITAGVYLATMGPNGMHELGQSIMERLAYAMARLSELPGITLPFSAQPHFKECVVNFDATGKSVADISQALRDRGIFAGHDLSRDFPALGQSALFCITEVHTQHDIDTLCHALKEIIE